MFLGCRSYGLFSLHSVGRLDIRCEVVLHHDLVSWFLQLNLSINLKFLSPHIVWYNVLSVLRILIQYFW